MSESHRKNATLAKSYRDLADWLDAHPLLCERMYGEHIFARDASDLAELAKLGDGWEKEFGESYVYLLRKFGNDVKVRLCIERGKICTRVKVGERTVKRQKVQVVGEEDVTEDVYEYDCPESILSPKGD